MSAADDLSRFWGGAVPLLSDAGFRRLAADVFGQGPLGTDAGMAIDEAEAERLVGPAPETEDEAMAALAETVIGVPVMVLCPENRAVPEDFTCPHTCKPGSCEGCPGNEGES